MLKSLARTGLAAAALAAVAAWPAGAQAQQSAEPWVPPEFLDQRRNVNDDQIRFCLNMSSAVVEFDRQVAQAIADALLLNATFHEAVSPFQVAPYDFRIPLSERDLFVTITNNCDAFMGIRLSPGQMPEWMTVSRPYFSSRVVLAATDPAITSLTSLGQGQSVASRLAAPGDVQLTAYLRALGEATRPTRVPYPHNGLVIERLLDGTVDAAFVWEPALYLATDGDPAAAGITSIFAPPFAARSLDFSVGFLTQDTFLRGLVDSAIDALSMDGTLERIEGGFTLQPPSP